MLSQQISSAQRPTDTPVTFYVGLQVGAHRYLVDYQSGYNEITTGPAHLQVGYQVSSHLAIQLGVGYRQERSAGEAASPTTGQLAGRFEQSHRTVDIPLVVRYTLTRRPANRFKFDLIGGVVMVRSRYRYDRTITEDGVITQDIHVDESVTDPYVTAGLGIRHRLSSKLDATLDAQLNKLTRDVQTDNRSLLRYYSVGLGLRYSFR